MAWVRAASYVLVGVAVAALIIAAASIHTPSTTSFPTSLASLSKTNSSARAEEHRLEVAAGEASACQTATQPLLNAISNLDSDLVVGLTFSAYSTEVAHASRADSQTADRITGATQLCLSKVGVPLEAALNDYIHANNVWNSCISDLNCSNDSIKPKLQADWAKASLKLRAVKQNLRALPAELAAQVTPGSSA